MEQVDDNTFKMVQNNGNGKEVHYPIVLRTIESIQALSLPCQNTESDVEFLCEDCPYDIVPKQDCGLAILQEHARLMKLEIEDNE